MVGTDDFDIKLIIWEDKNMFVHVLKDNSFLCSDFFENRVKNLHQIAVVYKIKRLLLEKCLYRE